MYVVDYATFSSSDLHLPLTHAPGQFEHLDLSATDVREPTMVLLAGACRELRTLRLNMCFDVTPACLALLLGHCAHLRELGLVSCRRVSAADAADLVLLRPALNITR
jgi:hypothetical protein